MSFTRVDMPKVTHQDVAREFGKGSRQFDPGGTASHHHDGHETIPLFHGDRIFRLFESKQDVPAKPEGIVKRLETRRKLLPFQMAEVAGAATERQDEVVVAQGILRANDLALAETEIEDLVKQDRDIQLLRQNRANGLRDVRGGKPSGGDLIEQRLKKVVVLAIDHGDASFRVVKLLAKGQSSEARAQHHDVRILRAHDEHNVS